MTELFCFKCCRIVNDVISSWKKKRCTNCETVLQYQCRICEKRYNNSNTMYNHLNYDCNKQALFKCEECDFRTKRKYHLQSHIQKQHIIHKCLACGKKCNTLRLLKSHQLNKCGSKILKCHYCSFVCLYEIHLQKHIQSSHKYECQKCNRRFKYRAYLKRHATSLCENK